MADYIQILFNVLILGGLAWFVLRESGGKYATNSTTISLIDDRFKQANDIAGDLLKQLGDIDYRLSEHEIDHDINNCMSPDNSRDKTDFEVAVLLGAELTDKAYQAGSKIVLDSLAREGRISHEPRYVHEEKAFNLDEFDVDETLKAEMSKEEKESGLPPIIAQMNERMGREFAAAGLKERSRGDV